MATILLKQATGINPEVAKEPSKKSHIPPKYPYPNRLPWVEMMKLSITGKEVGCSEMARK